ncbi:hypothetical protein G6F50_013069 [Rhizopus delemar]|uniref:Uncharacterized protein n=1 Tax=Rhizopus delemar TaxID=936053 RepID=A0A9P6YP09_9FUNG|nr:hypothetical protein G6F50_013069 [Rhizopus delemar]
MASVPGITVYMRAAQDINLGAADHAPARPAAAARRVQRPAGGRQCHPAADRPHRRSALRPHRQRYRPGALRRLRPAPDQRVPDRYQPVPGDPGDRTGPARPGRRAVLLPPALAAARADGAVVGRGAGAAAGQRSAVDQPQWHAAGGEPVVQPGAGRLAGRGGHAGRAGTGADRHACQHQRPFPGYRAGVPGVAGQPADADPGRIAGGLHHPRRALRELRAPAHHPVNAAFGRYRCGADAVAVGPGLLDHGADRHRAGGAALCDRHGRAELGAHPELCVAVRDAVAGPEHRGGLCRPAGSGLHRVLRGGRLYLGLAGLAALRAAPAVLGDPADRAGGGVPVRRAAGGAHAQAARGLPGHCDLGLRGNHPHFPEQSERPDQHHQRAAGHQPHRHLQGGRIRVRAHGKPLRHPLHRAREVLLPAARADAHHHRGVRAPAEFAYRPRVGSHS